MYSVSYCVACANCRKIHHKVFENLTTAEAANKFYVGWDRFDEESIQMGVVEAINSSNQTVAVQTKTLGKLGYAGSFTVGVKDDAFLSEFDLLVYGKEAA